MEISSASTSAAKGGSNDATVPPPPPQAIAPPEKGSNGGGNKRSPLVISPDDLILPIRNGKFFAPRHNWIAVGKLEESSHSMVNYFHLDLADMWPVLKKLYDMRDFIRQRKAFSAFVRDAIDEKKTQRAAMITGAEYSGTYLTHIRVYSNGSGDWAPTPSGVALDHEELRAFIQHLDRAIANAVCLPKAKEGESACLREAAHDLADMALKDEDLAASQLSIVQAYDRILNRVETLFATQEHEKFMHRHMPGGGTVHAREFARSFKEPIAYMALACYLAKGTIF